MYGMFILPLRPTWWPCWIECKADVEHLRCFLFRNEHQVWDIFSFGMFFSILDLGCKTLPQFQSLIHKNPSAPSFLLPLEELYGSLRERCSWQIGAGLRTVRRHWAPAENMVVFQWFKTGVMKWNPFGGNQTIPTHTHMYGNFEGCPF